MRIKNKQETAQLNRPWSWWKQMLVYTILFLIAAALVYAHFLVQGKTLLKGLGNVDGITQHYPSYTKIKRVLSQGGESWSWDVGLGASFFDIFKGRLTNPLTYILIAFPQKYLDIAYDFVTVLRQYLAGIAFIIFGREMKFSNQQNVLGAFCYVFSGWAFLTAITQGTFNNSLILFPLLIMGAERILNDKSPLIFILTEVLFLSTSVIWAYAAGMFSVLYFLVRYPYYYGKNGLLVAEDMGTGTTALEADMNNSTSGATPEEAGSNRKGNRKGKRLPQNYWKNFAKRFGGLVGDGIIGLMISAIYVESILYTTTSAVINSGYDDEQGLFYSLKTYFTMPISLVAIKEAHESYSAVFATILVAALLPLILWNIKKKRSTAGIMALFCLVIGLFPITGKFMNGMSYNVGRWYFIVTFFLVWAAMECLESEVLKSRKSFIVLFGWWFVLCAWIVGVCIFYLKMISRVFALQSLFSLCLMFLLLCALYIREIGIGKLSGASKHVYRGMSTIIVILMMVNVGFNSWMLLTEHRVESYMDKGELLDYYEQYVQRVVPEIQTEDTSFYRTDQLDDGFEKNNTNIVFGGRSINEYFSVISSDWLYLNKLMGNNAGYNRRMVSLSNANRSGLDYLMGVKYFLRDENYKEKKKIGYVPYGFEYWKTIDGVEVYKNTHCMGIGTSYSQYITESELLKYTALEREQVMLQAAVVKDKDADSMTGVKHASAEDLTTNVQSVDYSITDTKNITLDGADGGKMVVKKGDASNNGFTIHVGENLQNVQIVVSFENLNRKQFSMDEKFAFYGKSVDQLGYNKLKEYLYRQDFTGGTSFVVSASYGENSQRAGCYKDGNTGLNDVEDYNLNLGYYDNFSGDIKVHLDNAGEYTYDSIKVYAIPIDNYEENATKLDQSKFNLKSFDNDTVTGTVDNEEESIVYFSILNNAGWHVYVDGEEVDKIQNVNIAFTGVKVPAGKHKITLEYDYPGLVPGIAVMVAGILLLVFVLIRRRRVAKKQKNQL